MNKFNPLFNITFNSISENENHDEISKKNTKILGMEFAPLSTPWVRRKQTLSILIWSLVWSLIPLGAFVFAILLYFNFTLGLLYMGWILYDRNTRNQGGRSIGWIQRMTIWQDVINYFPLTLIKTVDLDPKKNYLFGAHPHGIFCVGQLGHFGFESKQFKKLFPNMTSHLLTVDKSFWIPFTRDLILTFGICPATKKSMKYLFNYPGGGQVSVLMPGGVPEQLESYPSMEKVKLKNRKGFIKLAIQNGTSLVPVYSFGENDLYEQLGNQKGTLFRRIQLICIKTVGFYMPVFNGRGMLQYSYGFLPKRIPVKTIVGGPIEVEKINEPTQEQIDLVYNQFVDSLKELFYSYREECGYPTSEIEII